MPQADVPPQRTPRVVTVALVAISLLALLGTVAAAQQGTEPTEGREPQREQDEELVQRGNDLYGAHCAICHGAEGRGTSDGPPIQDASPALVDFVIRTGRMPLPHPEARNVRRDPALGEDAREAIVAYVRTFAADEPEIPSPDPGRGELVEGRELYETNCVACHSPFAGGIAVSQEDLAPPLAPADPVEIAEAVRTGPGVMPVFSESVLSEEEMDSLITYLLFLRDRPTGGFTFGRSGPVSEGLAAWFVGGLLMVVAYFIGERRE